MLSTLFLSIIRIRRTKSPEGPKTKAVKKDEAASPVSDHEDVKESSSVSLLATPTAATSSSNVAASPNSIYGELFNKPFTNPFAEAAVSVVD